MVFLTETWLKPHHLDSEIIDSNWQLSRVDRPTEMKGGGVLIATRSTLSAIPMIDNTTLYDDVASQHCWSKIITEKNDLYIGCIYMKPNQTEDAYKSNMQAIDSVISKLTTNDICFVFGDFNLPGVHWGKLNEDDMFYNPSNITTTTQECTLEFFAEKGYSQICNITNRAGNVLDLVFTNAIDNYEITETTSFLPQKTSVHHKALSVNYLHIYDTVKEQKCTRLKYDFKNADYDNINNILLSVDWPIDGNLDELADHLITTLRQVIGKYVPRKIITTNKKAPWHDKMHSRLKNKRNKAYRRWKEAVTDEQKHVLEQIFLNCRNDFENYDKRLYEKYVVKSGSLIKSDPKNFWKFIDYKREINGFPALMRSSEGSSCNQLEICEMYRKFFQSVYEEPLYQNSTTVTETHATDDCLQLLTIETDELYSEISKLDKNKGAGPDGIPPIFLRNIASSISDHLCKIFNISLSTGSFPRSWRFSTITPVFKSGDRSKIENYRGISILDAIPKLFEQIVTSKLITFLEPKLSPHQHGFLKGRSTTTNLVDYTSHLFNELAEGRQVDCILTDFSKAFDKVNHQILIQKLNKIGIKGPLLNWVSSYLQDRIQKVKFKDNFSDPIKVHSGVPQGSHLGPVLFNVFINDLTDNFKTCRYLMYADDVKIFNTINSDQDAMLLQDDLRLLTEWCEQNHMHLNIKKCHVVSFSRRLSTLTFNYQINSEVLNRVTSTNDLGIVMDSKLSFKDHIEKIINNGKRILGFVKRRAKEFDDPYVTKALYIALVRPSLEYASVVWNGSIGETVSRKIESIQKQFLLFALRNLGWREDTFVLPPYTARLQLIDIQTLEQRRFCFDIMFAFDLINGSIKSPYLREKLQPNTNNRYSLRHNRPLVVPFHRRSYAFNEPITRCARAYNSVTHLNMPSMSRATFKRIIKSDRTDPVTI